MTLCIFHHFATDRLGNIQRQFSPGPYMAIRQWRHENPVFPERQDTERGSLNGDWLPVRECDRNFSATNTLVGKPRKWVLDGIAKHSIEDGARYAIHLIRRIKQVVSQSYPHRGALHWQDLSMAISSRTEPMSVWGQVRDASGTARIGE